MPRITRVQAAPDNRATAQEDATVTDVQAPDATAANATPPAGADGAAPAADKPKRKRAGAHVQLTVPFDMQKVLEDKAKESGKTAARWVLENIAADIGYTLPAAPERSPKGAMTLGLPKDMPKEAKQVRFDVARELLAKLQAGEEVDLEALRAKLQQAPAPAATPAPATA